MPVSRPTVRGPIWAVVAVADDRVLTCCASEELARCWSRQHNTLNAFARCTPLTGDVEARLVDERPAGTPIERERPAGASVYVDGAGRPVAFDARDARRVRIDSFGRAAPPGPPRRAARD